MHRVACALRSRLVPGGASPPWFLAPVRNVSNASDRVGHSSEPALPKVRQPDVLHRWAPGGVGMAWDFAQGHSPSSLPAMHKRARPLQSHHLACRTATEIVWPASSRQEKCVYGGGGVWHVHKELGCVAWPCCGKPGRQHDTFVTLSLTGCWFSLLPSPASFPPLFLSRCQGAPGAERGAHARRYTEAGACGAFRLQRRGGVLGAEGGPK